MIIKSDKIKEQVTKRLQESYKDQSKKLVIINQNNDLATLRFIKAKETLAVKLNVTFEVINFDLGDSTEKIISTLDVLNNDESVNGIVVQLPINNAKEILKHITIEKDVDCLSPYNLGLFMRGQSKFVPPVVFAVDEILKDFKKEIKGKKVLIIGSGMLTGEPLASYFMQKESELFVVNKYILDLPLLTKQADIIISATGVCNLINSEHITKGQLLIDLGGGSVDGKLVGDINTNSVKEICDIVPVPKGVGPLTVLGIFNNLLNSK